LCYLVHERLTTCNFARLRSSESSALTDAIFMTALRMGRHGQATPRFGTTMLTPWLRWPNIRMNFCHHEADRQLVDLGDLHRFCGRGLVT